MKVAIQGVAGSFHHEAATALLQGRPFELVPCTTFAEVFAAVQNELADYGVVAIENNIYGSINEIYRLLERYTIWITADIRLQIRQQLIGCQAVDLQILRNAGEAVHILSQAPALAQVDQWLAEHLPEAVREETHDTSDSVRMVVERDDPNYLAVAGEAAAWVHHGTIVAKDITDVPENYTRFLLFDRKPGNDPEATTCSLILRTDHAPGSLVRALQLFADNSISLRRIDSHPIVGDEQHYRFYIDADSGAETPAMQAVLAGLAAQNCEVHLLGSYRRVVPS